MEVHHFRWLGIAIALLLIFILIWPFITPLAFAVLLAYLLHPAHTWLAKRITRKISALLLTIITAGVVIAIISFGAKVLLTELAKAYLYISKFDLSTFFKDGGVLAEGLRDITRLLFTKFIEGLSAAVSAIPHLVLAFFVFFVSLFYFLLDGRRILALIQKNLLLKEKGRPFKEIGSYAYAFVYAWVLIAVVQGVIAFVGISVFKLPYPVLVALAAALLSIIPLLGAFLIYIPVGALALLNGNVLAGAGILIYGFTIATLLDGWAKPWIMGKFAKIHPLIVLVGLFGGLILLGAAGIIIGPILLLVAITMLKGTSLDFWRKSYETKS